MAINVPALTILRVLRQSGPAMQRKRDIALCDLITRRYLLQPTITLELFREALQRVDWPAVCAANKHRQGHGWMAEGGCQRQSAVGQASGGRAAVNSGLSRDSGQVRRSPF